MKILVCIKQIMASDTLLSGSGQWIEHGRSPLVISRFDENALEEAILLKEKLKSIGSADVSVDIVSAAHAGATDGIKRGMGMGADSGIHIITDDFGYVSASVTASRVAAMVRKKGKREELSCEDGDSSLLLLSDRQKRRDSNLFYDLILTGIMSEDLMQAQVGPMVAEHLKIPCVTSVVSTSIGEKMDEVTVLRELEGGIRQNIKVRLPALLTIQAGINQPRYPSLSNILRANRREINTFNVRELFSNEPPSPAADPLHLIRLEKPEKKREGRLLQGTTRDKATELMAILKQKGVI